VIFRYLAVLAEAPLAFVILIAAFTTSLLVGLVLHEVAHAFVADSLGDGTPRRHGRLSLNPVRHLDPLGSMLIFIVGFGWAKPVPIGPNSGRNVALIALAGPATNLGVAAVAGLAIKLGYVPFFHPFVAPSAADYWARVWTDSPDHLLGLFLGTIVLLNVILAVFNLIPLAPLDGFRVLADALKEHGPRLVIVDPALAAFAGNSNAAEAVREFLGALVALARNADTPFGILLLAHSRKSAREGDPDPFDPGQVGGSTHWTDTPRGVMTLTWKPLSWGGKPGDRVIAIPKANWGPQNIWADLLPVRSADGTYLAMDGRAVEGRANGNGKPIYWRIKSDTQPLGRADGIAAAHQLLTRRAAGRKGIRLNAEETDALRAVLAALSQDDATIGSGTRSANSATDFAGPPPR